MRWAGTRTRTWGAWLVVACAAALAAVFLTEPPAAAQQADPDQEVLQRGGELYQRWCATCHATDGTGTRDGPTLEDLGLAYVDLTMRTGRMPLADPERGVRERRFDDEERELVNAYLVDLLDLEDDVPDPPPGSPARGQELYTVQCAACHGATGSGGVSGAGTLVPAVTGLDRIALAQATRVGPFAMPPFPEEKLDDQQLGDIVDYIGAFGAQPRTPIGMIELNRVTAAAFGALLLAFLVLACRAAATWRTPRPSGDGAGPHHDAPPDEETPR